MILDNLNLVHFVLKKFSFNKSEYEDLFQEGVIGLIKAEQTYDINKKNSFSTYACVCIKNEILKYLRKNNKFNLLSLNEKLSNNNTFEDLLISEEKDVLSTLIESEIQEKINFIIDNKLNNREKTVIVNSFGINCEEMKQKDIMNLLNIKQYQVSRIKISALNKIKFSLYNSIIL